MELNDSRDSLSVDDSLLDEVEDIMCDQTIISGELSVVDLEHKTPYIIISAARLRVAVAVFARTVMPTVLKIYYLYQRNQQIVVDNVRHRLLPTLVAFLANSLSNSLASVQKRITFPLNRRAIKDIQKDLNPAIDDTTNTTPEESVDCQVLFSPKTEILADVIFIHGLHGGIDKTWKQGQWRHNGHKLKDQSPVRSQSTGNLYVPPRKHSLKRTLSDIYNANRTQIKVARKGNEVCVTHQEEWEVIEDVDVDDEGCYSNCWPQDWLPKDCPGVRVIALNYTTDVLWCPVWKKKRRRTDMVERSDEMIAELCKLGVGKQPIIWVGHSKGGLFIKQIIMNAWERHSQCPEKFAIFQNSKGIMFYSVPHKGSVLADFTLPLLRRSVELIEIQRNCDFVLDLHKRFLELCKQGHLGADIFSFIETSFTLMSFVYLKIVAYESADPDVGIKCDVPLDHREICKPAGRDCFLYLELIKLIKKHSLGGETM
ncbi:protein SERAC1 isoform X1 [Tribolium castaneum]|uniref:Protein SERAC1-like Protein n=1 Tax=Tribolium castaneum TaxID=7070 RepID=D6WBT2_TRICA|nr:PREDICTED: protein SERAC1 isoform X1 [Tribolium castaneum]EEZ98744.2 Protein SERAC1-like Protein [Tribolium castaneum]|eukprot:XP_968808.1 PREDICTED: protein SERAC1 isoform X1 [Tribolium castaneum]